LTRDTKDWGGNIAAFLLVIVMNVLSNALPINNQTMPVISAKYPSLFTPAGFTFSIWGVIYLALLVFVIYQALPAQRENQSIAGISRLFQINCIANAIWIVVWHYDLLAISVLVMLVILATLILIYRKLIGDRLILRLPFSLYTAWISLATIANISALQINSGWDDIGMSAIQWTLVKLAFAGAVGASVIVKLRDIAFVLVVAWAAYGISVMQVDTPAVAGAAMTLSLLGLMLAGAAIWSSFYSSR
jgi:benzodiazapine receptor